MVLASHDLGGPFTNESHQPDICTILGNIGQRNANAAAVTSCDVDRDACLLALAGLLHKIADFPAPGAHRLGPAVDHHLWCVDTARIPDCDIVGALALSHFRGGEFINPATMAAIINPVPVINVVFKRDNIFLAGQFAQIGVSGGVRLATLGGKQLNHRDRLATWLGMRM